jgi:A/G-specific adenine glycosylase
VLDNLRTDPGGIAGTLLDWYDANARDLPWRAPPGANAADPYRVWLSEIMLQQTQVASVIPYFEKFTTRWPDFESFAAAEDADVMSAWAGLGYYARTRNLLACARAVASAHGGRLPSSEAELLKLPGIGAYTAAAIASIAFGQRAVVVDGNVERVVSRLFAVETPLPAARPELRLLTDTITPDTRAGDFAQAMMDLGSGICTPKSPKCLLCPLAPDCAARAKSDPATYPRRLPKRAKPQRFGTIFLLHDDDRVLLVRRPDKGLLGGMRAFPTGLWNDEAPGLADAPVATEWQPIDAEVTHVFTHFALRCALVRGTWDGQSSVEGEWWPIADLDSAGLPTVFAKAIKHLGETDR